MDLRCSRRASVDIGSALRSRVAARPCSGSGSSSSGSGTRKTVSLTLCLISTEQDSAPQVRQEEKKKQKKQTAVQRIRQSLLHWGRNKGNKMEERPARPPPPPPAPAPGRPGRPTSLRLPQKVIGQEPVVRRGSHGDTLKDLLLKLPEDGHFKALGEGPHPRPYAVGAPLTSSAPISSVPTSSVLKSSVPTSSAITSNVLNSSVPTSSVRTSSVPTSSVRTSSVLTPSVPTSSVPTSSALTSSVPTSSIPTSNVLTSSVPTSSVPASSALTSSVPTSSIPTSNVLTSSVPTSSVPTSSALTSSVPISSVLKSSVPTSSVLTSATTPAAKSPATTTLSTAASLKWDPDSSGASERARDPGRAPSSASPRSNTATPPRLATTTSALPAAPEVTSDSRAISSATSGVSSGNASNFIFGGALPASGSNPTPKTTSVFASVSNPTPTTTSGTASGSNPTPTTTSGTVSRSNSTPITTSRTASGNNPTPTTTSGTASGRNPTPTTTSGTAFGNSPKLTSVAAVNTTKTAFTSGAKANLGSESKASSAVTSVKSRTASRTGAEGSDMAVGKCAPADQRRTTGNERGLESNGSSPPSEESADRKRNRPSRLDQEEVTKRLSAPRLRGCSGCSPPPRAVGSAALKRTQSVSPARRKTATVVLRNSLVHIAARNSSQIGGQPQRWPAAGGMQVQQQPPPHSPLSPGWDLVALEMEVLGLRRELQARRAEELRLRREIHKLRSVLQQATSFSQDGEDEVGEDETNEGALLTSLQARHTMAGGRVGAAGAAGAATGGGGGSCTAPTFKKQGVSGESTDPGSSPITQTTFPKDFRSQQLIKAAILDNDFLKNLSRGQIRELVDCMYPQSVTRGSYVIREGQAGCHLYVLAEGEMEVLKEGTVLGRMGPGKAFGELAILYNCTRTASIRAVTDLQVWVLDRKVFQQIMMRTGLQRIEENLSFLSSVPLLRHLSPDTLAKIADVLEVEFYGADCCIVRQGASGHTFFIISGGTVQVTQRVPGTGEEVVIRTLGRGDYFGEQALLHDEHRTASVIAEPPGVECLTLDRESFLALIGSLSELQEKDYGDNNRQVSRTSSAFSLHSDYPSPDCEVDLLCLEDLQVIGTLGVGGFGSVRLVVAGGRSYALKCLNKSHIVATGQQEHVLGERDILMTVHSPFIVRLFRTFRDERCVYFLLEACLGGEVWSMLRQRGPGGGLEELEARFTAACVVQALDYLHSRCIVYRDLKPENLVLDARGYVKLVDFGFSKRLVGSSRTWTFCGTPEYVAPEVILNRGHDRAVDYWALGVLVFELLTGAPPFTAPDPMRTYNLILKGIEAVPMPRAVNRAAANLIRRLCRPAAAERLGYQRAGLQDLRQHKWFQGFDWEGLVQQTLQPPIVPQVSGPTDMSNFDTSSKEEDIISTELSNWEADF